jgi:GMP synthase (glutamine-hydrolysing)
MMLDAEPTSTTAADRLDRVASGGDPSGKPVLLVLHQVRSNPGHIGQWFERNGHALDIRRHFAGEPLPETLEHHCGAVIFGGPQSANDNLDYIKQETEWIGVALK